MLEQYNPLTTVKEASIQSGLTIKKLNKLIKDKVIVANKIGGSTLYIDNLSLESYLEESRKEAYRNKETTIRSYKIALKKAIHEEKVKAVKLNLKAYQKSQKVIKMLMNKHYFTESIIEQYCEEGADLTKVINRNGKLYDVTAVEGNQEVLEFFKTYNTIKEDYNKIDYPLDTSVIAEIETKLKEKFEIDSLDKGSAFQY